MGFERLRIVIGALRKEGFDPRIIGGWAEELRGVTPTRLHGDVDLVLINPDLERLDRFVAPSEVWGKRFFHKRAYVFDDMLVECDIATGTSGTLTTLYWGDRPFTWPSDLLGPDLDGLPVAGPETLRLRRAEFARLHGDDPWRDISTLIPLTRVEPSIRSGTDADVRASTTVLRYAYATFKPHIEAALWKDYIDEIADVSSRIADSDLVVAINEGQVFGVVSFYPDASRSSFENWPSGVSSIRALGVAPVAQGHGIGTLLVAECVNRARALHRAAVVLHTMPFMSAAIATYEKLGFTRTPEHDQPHAGHTVLAYRLDL